MHHPPQIKPISFTPLALPVEKVMPNGVRLFRIPGDGKGSVRLDILFDGGYGVQSKPLQAMFVNRMLREGCNGMSASEISCCLDYHGAWIDSYSSQNCNHLTLHALSRHFLPLVELLAKIVKSPDFPVDNLEVVRNNNKSYFVVNSRKVDILSQRYFEQSLWGESHPLGHVVCPDDYDAITRDDIWDYYNSVYGSRNCTLFIGGSVDDAMLDAVERYFGQDVWGSSKSLRPFAVPVPQPVYGRKYIHLDGTLQSSVKIGFMAMDSNDADFFRFRFLSVLLGGYFGSRLMSNIREENGYTYHIAAELDAYGKKNAFMISSEAANEYVEALVKEVYHEINALLDAPPPASEVQLVRNYILGELCREYEGVSAKSEVFINTWLSGESFASVNEYAKVVASVAPDDLHDVAKRYFSRDRMIEIVVGAV